jgi:hypothetical protein
VKLETGFDLVTVDVTETKHEGEIDGKRGSVLKRMMLKRVSLYIVTREEKTGLAKCVM